jgi:hypothetical protein
MVSAANVSVARRCAQVAFAVFFCLTCAGIIFGFAGVYLVTLGEHSSIDSTSLALKPVLVSEGVYADLCNKERLGTGQTTPCKEQVSFKLIFYFICHFSCSS